MNTQRINYVPDSLNIFPGFYESQLYYSDMEYNYNYNEKYEFEKYMDCEIDDFKAYCRDVCEELTDEIKDLLVDDEICTNVELVGMSSPREYNFTTDKLELNIDVNLWRIATKVWYDEDLHKGFDKYLQKKYTSCSGYISFVANNIDEYFDRMEWADVLLDYWLLTKIYDDTDVVKCIMRCDITPYEERMYEIADNALYRHMAPISEVEYVRENMSEDKMQEWCKAKFAADRAFYGDEWAKRIISECRDEFYQAAGIFKYEEAENVRMMLN